MLYLPFTFRVSTKEEIDLFSEEFSNVYALNPEVKFTTAELHKENYAIFATKDENDETLLASGDYNHYESGENRQN